MRLSPVYAGGSVPEIEVGRWAVEVAKTTGIIRRRRSDSTRGPRSGTVRCAWRCADDRVRTSAGRRLGQGGRGQAKRGCGRKNDNVFHFANSFSRAAQRLLPNSVTWGNRRMLQAEHGRRAPRPAGSWPDHLALAERERFAEEASANEKDGPRCEADENGTQQRQHEGIVRRRPVGVTGRIGGFCHEHLNRNCLN